MDVQKIKELALANGFKLKEQADGSMDLNAYVYDFANAIEQAAKAQAVPEWISVNERLPEFSVPVFAGFYRDGEFIWWIFERYDEDEGWGWARYEGDLESDVYADEYDITHWQPLLEEPKADTEG